LRLFFHPNKVLIKGLWRYFAAGTNDQLAVQEFEPLHMLYIQAVRLGSIGIDITTIGASGAIFGLYGIFLIPLLTNVFPKNFRKAMLLNTTVYVSLNLLMGLAGGIDNAAHIGGLLSGGVIDFCCFLV